MASNTTSAPLPPLALLTKEPFVVQVTETGAVKKKRLFPSLGELSSALTSVRDSKYYVDDQELQQALAVSVGTGRPTLSEDLLSLQKAKRDAKRNASAMLHQTLVAEAGPSVRKMPERLLKDLTTVATGKIPVPEEQERFKQLFQQSLEHFARVRALAKADAPRPDAIDFQTAEPFREEVYIIGSLFPLLRHGLAHRIAKNIVAAHWSNAPSKIEVHVSDDLQLSSVKHLLLECVKQHYILKQERVPNDTRLTEIWNDACSDKKQALSVVASEAGRSATDANAHARLFNGRTWYRASIHEQVPRLVKERVRALEAAELG